VQNRIMLMRNGASLFNIASIFLIHADLGFAVISARGWIASKPASVAVERDAPEPQDWKNEESHRAPDLARHPNDRLD
jgi:hypothetical protein